MHVTGEHLSQITGVAAILRFPIPGIDEDWHDDNETNEQLEFNIKNE